MILNLNGRPVNGEAYPLAARPVLIPLRANTEAKAQALPGIVKSLQDAAARDNHVVIAPTHVMMKGDEIVGYLSLNGMPMVHAWFDSKHPKATDSLKMIEHGETAMRETGLQVYTVAVAGNSPFSPHMERMGFRKLGVTEIWIKQL